MSTAANTQDFLPPVPRPPHDPTWLLLDGRAGWRAALLEHVEVSPSGAGLTLSPLAASLRALDEPSGSFGGLVPPSNVACAADGHVYLLDLKAAVLKLFDPCECRFLFMPCTSGPGVGARQLKGAHGIGINGGDLFICDTGNRRLCVYALRGFTLRGFWSPPASARLTNEWEPYAVAFDSKARVYVSDPANGCVHRFSRRGRWEKCLMGFGKVTHITFDCRERLYAVVEGEQGVRLSDAEGNGLGVVTRVDAAAVDFPTLPFEVDVAGNVSLGRLCAPAAEDCGHEAAGAPSLFDLAGDPATAAARPPAPLFEKSGTYLSEPLDSLLYRCQWHRVVLGGQVPSGTRVKVSTYTAEALLTQDQLLDLPEDAWQTKQTAWAVERGGEWDCLVTGGQGRYLWLRLELKGKGTATPSVGSVRVEFPRVSLKRYLPAVFGEDPAGEDFTDRFLSIFDTTIRGVEKTIDEQARFFDPLSTPAEPGPGGGADFLSWLASWIGITLDRQWPVEQRRQFVKHAASLYALRGTREGLRRQLIFLLGMGPALRCCPCDAPRDTCRTAPPNCAPPEEHECAWQPPPLILEHYQLRRWLFVGAARLGSQAVVWGKRIVGRSQLDANAQTARTKLNTTQDPFRDPFHVYAHKFSVFVPACYRESEAKRRSLENLLNSESPGHAQHQLVYVEPRFRIGFQAMIGLDTVVGRYPAGVTLNQSPLGEATVLTAPPGKSGVPGLAVGKSSRVGTTTRLE
jgi:phage tail-like protein